MIILNSSLSVQTIVSEYDYKIKQELTGVGSFTLTIPSTLGIEDKLVADNLIYIDEYTPVGLIIQRNIAQSNNGKMITITGTCAIGYLNRRIVRYD